MKTKATINRETKKICGHCTHFFAPSQLWLSPYCRAPFRLVFADKTYETKACKYFLSKADAKVEKFLQIELDMACEPDIIGDVDREQ